MSKRCLKALKDPADLICEGKERGKVKSHYQQLRLKKLKQNKNTERKKWE